MSQLVSLIIGFILKASFDLALGLGQRFAVYLYSRIPFRMYHKDYIADLEAKAKSLALLTKAYEQLKEAEIRDAENIGKQKKWR